MTDIKLIRLAQKIKRVPYEFRGIGETVDLLKVKKALRNYGN